MAMQGSATSRIEASPHFIEGDEPTFRAQFNRTWFSFSHHLAGHPLFELPRLLQLTRSMDEEDMYFDAGDARIGQRWDEMPPCRMSIDEMIDRIENAGAWIILKRTNHDPEYGALLERCLAEIQGLIGADLRKQMKLREAIIFITSPNRITTYHIDRECNFLLQIRGEKVITIFDKYDRTVLPEEELERFWTLDNNAALYKEQYQNRADAFHLRPGTGVHIPVNAPHWVANSNNISVSLSVNFQYHDRALANIYRTNYFLRKVGLRPSPPGRSKFVDAVKGSTMGCALGLRNAWKQFRRR
jgi:hypothetical protein